MLTVEKIQAVVAPLAEKYHIDRVFLFGSYARGDSSEKSDVDLRIEQENLKGLAFSAFYVDVADGLACPVDILTTRQIPKDFLTHIQGEEILLYDRAKQRPFAVRLAQELAEEDGIFPDGG